jgi:hypothetical protein
MLAKKVQDIQTESSEWDQSIILMKQINRKYRSSGTEPSGFCLEKFPRRIGRSTTMGKALRSTESTVLDPEAFGHRGRRLCAQ